MSENAVRAAFAEQATWCRRLGSPFTALLCETIGSRIDRVTETGRRVLDWPGDPLPGADSVPLRLCGGLHYLVRRGAAPGLARLYPPAGLPEAEALWTALRPVLEEQAAAIQPWLDNPPQTNEVGRSAVLMSGLLAIAAQFRMGLRLFELGSSAGLNLLLDRYDYAFGGIRTGSAGSPVRLAPEWRGPPPPQAAVEILSRSGVDLRPIDPGRDGEKLLAYVWADQLERRGRLQAAIAIAAAEPPPVAQGDAAEWLEERLPAAPQAGAVRVVMHSVAFQYFADRTQQRIAGLIESCGATAGEEAPLAWLRYEHLPGEAQTSLRLRTWPGGEDRLLAFCHAHGASVEWVGSR